MKYKARDQVVGLGAGVSGSASRLLPAYGERVSISVIGLEGVLEREVVDREGRGDEVLEFSV